MQLVGVALAVNPQVGEGNLDVGLLPAPVRSTVRSPRSVRSRPALARLHREPPGSVFYSVPPLAGLFTSAC